MSSVDSAAGWAFPSAAILGIGAMALAMAAWIKPDQDERAAERAAFEEIDAADMRPLAVFRAGARHGREALVEFRKRGAMLRRMHLLDPAPTRFAQASLWAVYMRDADELLDSPSAIPLAQVTAGLRLPGALELLRRNFERPPPSGTSIPYVHPSGGIARILPDDLPAIDSAFGYAPFGIKQDGQRPLRRAS